MNANPSANGPANRTPCIPNIFPKMHIGPAVCVPVVTIYCGLNLKYKYIVLHHL